MAELKKTLGFWMLSAIAFLSLVNTGLFFGIKIGAQQAGIDSLVAWGILAIMGIYIAMCFSELSTMFPTAGGIYEFSKQAYGRFISFLIGWTAWVAGNIATALFTVAAIDYIYPNVPVTLLSFTIPSATAKLLICLLTIFTLNFIAYRGIEASAKFMMVLSIFMLFIMGMIIIPGFSHINIQNLGGFTVAWSPILLAMFLLSETFFGWEAVTFMSEETKDPEKTIPRVLITSAIFVTILSIGLIIVTIGVLGIKGVLASDRTIIEVLQHMQFLPQLVLLANIGIVVTMLGNASGDVVTLPRLLLALSRDKLFIEQFSDIHPKYQTPYKAIMFQTVVASSIVVMASGAYQKLLELLVPISLGIYIAVIVLVPYFRWKIPDQPRPYKAPLARSAPWLVAAFFLSLLVLWAVEAPNAIAQLRLLFSFLFFSVPIYLILTYFYDPDQLINTMNFFSRINWWFEDILIPRQLRRDVLEFFVEPKGKHVLEFGSGVGTLTRHLAEHVGKDGKVYAVGLSRGDIAILERRMKKLGHTHVEVIHDPHLVNRVHPNVKKVDVIVSIGHLSYIQDVKKVLREMNALLPEQGNIYFIEYVDFFSFLPNPKWLSNHEELKKTFAECGFSVTINKKRGLFWNYLHIYGIKESRNVPYI